MTLAPPHAARPGVLGRLITRCRTLPLALGLCVPLLCAGAQAQPRPEPDIPALIRAAQLPLTGDPVVGRFAGAGWDRLVEDGTRAQFFMVGEQHGVREIILFATALHAQLAHRGYSHAALEVGPYSTQRAEQLIRSGPGRLEAFVRRPGHSGIFPFLSLKEEIALAEQYVRLSPAREALWGLDQEYVGSAPILRDLLSARARTTAQRAAVARLTADAAANPLLVRDLAGADLRPLRDAFRRDAQALRAIEAYRLSGEIYAPFTVPGSNRYFANFTRENYIKRNFAAAFAQAERQGGRPPKVFMKFGGSHAMRGITVTAVPGFANFLAEWGLPRGFGLINVMVDCVAVPGSRCRPYFGTDHGLYEQASDQRFTLYDLRPLRARLRSLPALDTQTRDLVQAFDFYVLIRETSPAQPAYQ